MAKLKTAVITRRVNLVPGVAPWTGQDCWLDTDRYVLIDGVSTTFKQNGYICKNWMSAWLPSTDKSKRLTVVLSHDAPPKGQNSLVVEFSETEDDNIQIHIPDLMELGEILDDFYQLLEYDLREMAKTKAVHPFVGKKIIGLRWMSKTEMDHNGWYEDVNGPPAVLVLEGGDTVFASCDPEGNGPGCMYGTYREGNKVKDIYVMPSERPRAKAKTS